MLQRIYGTAWNSKQELDAYLNRLEEAKQSFRDVLTRNREVVKTTEPSP